jgi:hypothetical protein
VNDQAVHWLCRCQSIWKSHSSFKHKVWEWLLCQQGLVVKHRLHNIGVIDVVCVLCGKDEIVEHGFLEMSVSKDVLVMV